MWLVAIALFYLVYGTIVAVVQAAIDLLFTQGLNLHTTDMFV